MTGPVRFAVLTALVFGLIYNVSFLAAPAVSTGRLALLGLVILAGREGWRELRTLLAEYAAFVAILALLVVYALALYLSSGRADTTQVSRLVNLAVLSIAGAVLTVVACGRDLSRFSRIFATAAMLQAVCIAVSFVSPDYRRWLATVLIQGGNIPLTSALQAPGFSNSSGALLSLQQGLGVFAGLLAMRLASTRRDRLLFLVTVACCALSTLVVGRTGLSMALVFLVLFGVTGAPRGWWRIATATGAILLLFAFQGERMLTALTSVNPSAPASLERAFQFLIQGRSEASYRELANQRVPSIDIETVLGTGLVAAAPGRGNASGNDSGYIQTFFALGLPMALVFYLTLLYLVTMLWGLTRQRATLAGLLLLMFVVEVKEPFIFKYTYLYLLLTLLWLDRSFPGVAAAGGGALRLSLPPVPPDMMESV